MDFAKLECQLIPSLSFEQTTGFKFDGIWYEGKLVTRCPSRPTTPQGCRGMRGLCSYCASVLESDGRAGTSLTALSACNAETAQSPLFDKNLFCPMNLR